MIFEGITFLIKLTETFLTSILILNSQVPLFTLEKKFLSFLALLYFVFIFKNKLFLQPFLDIYFKLFAGIFLSIYLNVC